VADLYYIAPDYWHDEYIVLDKPLRHRFFKVMRLPESFGIVVTNGLGKVAEGMLLEDRIVLKELEISPDDRIPISVYLAILKRDKMDWAISKLGELGVKRIVPVFTERSVVRKWGDKQVHRCQKLLASALEIRRKSWLTECAYPVSLGNIITEIDIFFDVEGESDSNMSFPVSVLVGPEGGLSPSEKKNLLNARARPMRLTNGILRAETAVLVGVTMVACKGGLL